MGSFKIFSIKRRRDIIDKINFDASTPIFLQIVDSILSDIATGTLKPSEKIESVRLLASRYKVNPNTMQKSLEKLGDMGFLYTERTSGRFVTDDVAKIQALRQEIPARITKEYIEEMLSAGVSSGEIPNYVNKFLKEREANGKNSRN
ncbi:MAG: GntR family transcriptional regulator [Defluviitaleaceae bacterium]|nr:GntR family transcriptional regulator [Defluviitaleaceae bacterium]